MENFNLKFIVIDIIYFLYEIHNQDSIINSILNLILNSIPHILFFILCLAPTITQSHSNVCRSVDDDHHQHTMLYAYNTSLLPPRLDANLSWSSFSNITVSFDRYLELLVGKDRNLFHRFGLGFYWKSHVNHGKTP